ncbi:hypothetical protein AB0O20_05185 [Streptomyces kronopolitis]|uniref:hypothetical protein n=1 Tax=Streptomyces kronopolitis TaxID=1612435 RepID=UPI0034327F02
MAVASARRRVRPAADPASGVGSVPESMSGQLVPPAMNEKFPCVSVAHGYRYEEFRYFSLLLFRDSRQGGGKDSSISVQAIVKQAGPFGVLAKWRHFAPNLKNDSNVDSVGCYN